MNINEHYTIASTEALRELYGPPLERAVLKQMDHLDEHSRAFIAASPFLILTTCGISGMDCSPRGDRSGFVEVADDTTLLLPDRRGNNRADSLLNIVQNPAVGLIFLVPGINETFRVNGRALVSTDPALCKRFVVNGKQPKSVVVVTVEEAFIHCPRALVRSDLWNPENYLARVELPSMGTVLAAHTGGNVDAAQYDEQAKVLVPQTLY